MKVEKSNALKAVLESPYELVVENRIVIFGGRDLTGFALGKNQDGSLGEYFSKATNLESDYTASGRLYVDFEHGRDPDEIGNTKHDILGFVDWKTAKVDDEGVIVRRVLNRRHRYMKWLEPLIKAGLVGNSSASVEGQSEKAANGEITKWPLERDTLTVNPMEPRMLEGNTLTALKSLAEDFPQYKSLIPPDAALPDKDDQPLVEETKQEINEMDEKEIQAIAEKAAADALARRDAEDKAKTLAETERQAAIKAAEDAGYAKALEDVKGKKAPAFNTEKLGFSEEKDAVPGFKAWIMTGQPNGALITPPSNLYNIKAGDDKAAFNISDGATGGYLIPDPLLDRIIAKRNLASWVRQAPCQHFVSDTDHLLIPIEATSHAAFTLTAEKAAYTEDEGTIDQVDLALLKYTKETRLTEEFLSGKNSNWEAWFSEALGRAVAVTENTLATTAILDGATAAAAAASATAITAAELARTIGSLGAGYNVTGECGFLTKNATKWYCKGLTPGDFAFMSPTPSTPDIFGYPIYVSDDMAAMTTTLKSVLFANFSYFAVLERPGMLVQRNPYLYMATGQIGIFSNIYRAFKTLQTEAVYTMAQA